MGFGFVDLGSVSLGVSGFMVYVTYSRSTNLVESWVSVDAEEEISLEIVLILLQ